MPKIPPIEGDAPAAKPSVLWYGNFPAHPVGYGVVTGNVLRRLVERKWKIGLMANTLGPMFMTWEGYPTYGIISGRGEWETFEFYERDGWDILLTLGDVWGMENLPRLTLEKMAIWVPYVPIDMTAPHPWIMDLLRPATHVVAMSDYGLGILRKGGFNNSTRIHHGVDRDVYRPLIGEDHPQGWKVTKEELKARWGFDPDAFVVGLVQMNRGVRKLIPHQFEMLRTFRDQNPDIKLRIWAHMLRNNPSEEGFDLDAVAKEMGLNDIITYPDRIDLVYGYEAVPWGRMPMLYNTFDVLMSATSSEGFGLPIIEAQACGIPVVATDCTSMTELLEPTPELRVKVKSGFWEPRGPMKISIPDPADGVRALEQVLNRGPESYSAKLREWALKMFDWEDVIVPQWEKLFLNLGVAMGRMCRKVPGPSDDWKDLRDPREEVLES